MLERRLLLIRDWAPARIAGTAMTRLVRAIVAEDGTALGSAWEESEAPAWLSWLTRPPLTVHESDDEPLLFTVHRLWGFLPAWEGFEADGHRVGRFNGTMLEDRYVNRLATVEAPDSAAAGCLRDPAEDELVRWSRTAEGVELTFLPAVAEDPFVKMVMLAAVLELTG